MMLFSKVSALAPVLALLLAGSVAGNTDISEELAQGWKLALRPRQATQNLQAFQGALGGASADAITNSGNTQRPFSVDGDTFPDFATAANRACDNQKNACAKIANEKQGGAFTVGDCDQQNNQCKQQANAATKTSFDQADQTQGSAPVLVSSNANFDFFCDV